MNDTASAYILGEQPPAKLLAAFKPDAVVQVPLKYISVENGFNVRDFDSFENKDHLARLAKLIGANGIEVPVQVRIVDGRIVLVDGESRIRAAHAAVAAGSTKAETVPALLDPEGADETRRTESLVVKNSGRPLAMLETLDVVKRLKALGKTQPDIQAALGFSRYHMANLGLLDLSTEPVREHLRAGRVSPTTVIELVREYKDHPDVVEKSVADAIRDAEKQAAKKASTGPIKVTRQSFDKSSIVYTKSTFYGFMRVLQKLLQDLVPATEHRRRRSWIKQALENAGAPLEPTDDEE